MSVLPIFIGEHTQLRSLQCECFSAEVRKLSLISPMLLAQIKWGQMAIRMSQRGKESDRVGVRNFVDAHIQASQLSIRTFQCCGERDGARIADVVKRRG